MCTESLTLFLKDKISRGRNLPSNLTSVDFKLYATTRFVKQKEY